MACDNVMREIAGLSIMDHAGFRGMSTLINCHNVGSLLDNTKRKDEEGGGWSSEVIRSLHHSPLAGMIFVRSFGGGRGTLAGPFIS